MRSKLTESGQVFNTLSSHFNMLEYDRARGLPPVPNAVIHHFAAYAHNMLVPDNKCFRGNVLSTYKVIEAAVKLGIKKVIIANAETVYGICFAQGDTGYHSFPLDEVSHDGDPENTWATSK